MATNKINKTNTTHTNTNTQVDTSWPWPIIILVVWVMFCLLITDFACSQLYYRYDIVVQKKILYGNYQELLVSGDDWKGCYRVNDIFFYSVNEGDKLMLHSSQGVIFRNWKMTKKDK